MSSFIYLAADMPFTNVCRADDSFCIYTMEEKTEDILTEKKYCIYVQCDLDGTEWAQTVFAYIKEQMKHQQELEIWHIWMGAAYPPPRIRQTTITVDNLTADKISELEKTDVWQSEPLLKYTTVPNEWEIAEDELEVSTQYCYKIVK